MANDIMSIEVKGADIRTLANELKDLPGDPVFKAFRAVLSKALVAGRTIAIKQYRTVYPAAPAPLLRSLIRTRMVIRAPNVDGISAALSIENKDLGLSNLKPEIRKGKGGGVQYIGRGGSFVFIQGAFKAKMPNNKQPHFWIRQGRERFPVTYLRDAGSSPANVLKEGSSIAAIQARMFESVNTNLGPTIERYIKRSLDTAFKT